MSLEKSKKYNNTKRKINGICKALSMETKDYDPKKTVDNIQNYLDSKDKMERILYSEISSYVFAMDMTDRGIFAAIVLAFVGGITFSSSVLQNINSVSIYRLLMVVVLLAFVLVNVIWLLIKFISEINDKGVKLFNIKLFNATCVIMCFFIIVSWVLNFQSVSEYLRNILPWCK